MAHIPKSGGSISILQSIVLNYQVLICKALQITINVCRAGEMQ